MPYRKIERLLLVVGVTLCVIYLAVLGYREIGSRLAVRSFELAAKEAASLVVEAKAPPARTVSLEGVAEPDYSLWAAKRIAAYRDSLARRFAPPAAILRIPRLRLEVPVFDTTDELALNRGVGRIAGTARFGESGNLGIAGHRDGFFRGLKNISVGDVVTLSSASGTTTYAVDKIRIVTPQDVSVLAPRPAPSVTLVTCYPFYFDGDAPQRFIVHCSRRDERQVTNPGSGRTE
jgi:sortase A